MCAARANSEPFARIGRQDFDLRRDERKGVSTAEPRLPPQDPLWTDRPFQCGPGGTGQSMASLARRSLPFILATRRAHTAPLPAGTGVIARPNHPSGHMQELSADDDRHGGCSPPEAHKPQRKLRVRGGFRTAGQQLFSAPAPRGEPYEIMKACDVAAALADDGARWTWPTRSPSWQPLTNLLMLHYHARVGPRTEFALAHTPVRRRLAASAASCAQFCFRRRRQRRRHRSRHGTAEFGNFRFFRVGAGPEKPRVPNSILFRI